MNRNANRGVAIVLALGATGVLALGVVLQSQASFSKNYVQSELSSQRIVFTAVAKLRPAQQKVPCLVANAGKVLTTGAQAECYANYQIGIDLTGIDHGKTYFQEKSEGFVVSQAAAQAQATNPNTPKTLALQQQATQIQQYANALLTGEELRGLLLTAFGFGMIGDRLAQGALACFIIAGLLALAAVAAGTVKRDRPEGRKVRSASAQTGQHLAGLGGDDAPRVGVVDELVVVAADRVPIGSGREHHRGEVRPRRVFGASTIDLGRADVVQSAREGEGQEEAREGSVLVDAVPAGPSGRRAAPHRPVRSRRTTGQ